MDDRQQEPPSTHHDPAAGSAPRVAFGRFRFDTETGELWRDGLAVRLAPKPGQVLRMLLRSAGGLVSRREIEVEVWGDVPIDLDRSVNFAIRQIRSALGDSADSPRYIETLPKRGYRFIAPVSWPRTVASGDAGPLDPSRVSSPQGRARGTNPRGATRRTSALLILAGGVLAMVLGLRGLGVGLMGETAGLDRPMLAVLPISQLREDEEQAYFASGLTDELITRLSRLDPDQLGVIARTSSRLAALDGGPTDLEAAGRLSADYVLTGSVASAGERVRISVRLMGATDGAVIWADRYDEPVPTSPELEFEIASRVADALRNRLIPDLAAIRGESVPVVPAAREAFLRGSWLARHGPDRRSEALEYLHAAVAEDSTWAEAHVTLGRILIRTDRESGRTHLLRASDLDPSLATPHVALGMDALYTGWDMEAAGRYFRRALQLEPGNVLSHHPYSYYLSIAGQHDSAIRHVETALRLDPVSPLVNGDVGRIYYRANRFGEARRQCERTLELAPAHAVALSCLVNISMLEGDPEGAAPYARRLLAEDSLVMVGAADPMQRFFEFRLAEMRSVAERFGQGWVAAAQAAVWLGRTDEALELLELALANRSDILPQVPGDPCFAILAGNPRFDRIVRAMGIP